ncbi:hypothetical protein NEF87_002083 [Candidatus Lokiarchaeum ossiferum]|uniref:Tail specific protease domain-containing protein n=1 Tax=Candidatus Lokiarchaeum ossiferum TaxID=2951803 RepID=A0ABY6HR32_9ARCH|nr:hypothetical protein NEF87_002083 [Candidatus Lokiarchaeum sp. B-35]
MQELISKNENDINNIGNYWTPAKPAELLQKLGKLVKNKYIFPDMADKLAIHLSSSTFNKNHAYFTTPLKFAQTLTEELQNFSNDLHFFLEYNPEKAKLCAACQEDPTNSEVQTQDYFDLQRYRNGNLVEVRRLPGNIGYIRLDEFPEPELFGETILGGLKFLENTLGIIFDVRNNGGGHAEFVQIIISYFFGNERKLLYTFEDKDTGEMQQMWTLPLVGSKKGIHKPISILTSRRSASAAEDLAYTMQTHKRAKIVGEQTRGAANNPKQFAIDDNFLISIPVGRPINAITNTNWEQVGVTPDISVKQEIALETAHIDLLQQIEAQIENPRIRTLFGFEKKFVNAMYNQKQIPKELIQKMVGDYGGCSIQEKDGKILLIRKNMGLPLITTDFQDYYYNEQLRISFKFESQDTYLYLDYRDYSTKQEFQKNQ